MTITAKPFGPIPPEFAELRQLPWLDVSTPAYVYDFAVIEARIALLRAAKATARLDQSGRPGT